MLGQGTPPTVPQNTHGWRVLVSTFSSFPPPPQGKQYLFGGIWGSGHRPCNRVPLVPSSGGRKCMGVGWSTSEYLYHPPQPSGAHCPRIPAGRGQPRFPTSLGEGRGPGKGAASPHGLQGAAWLLEGVRDPTHPRHSRRNRGGRQTYAQRSDRRKRPRAGRPSAPGGAHGIREGR